MALLEVKNLGIQFGGLRAVDEFNLEIEKGALYGLIGPNGAGKTTVFNMLTGVYKPTAIYCWTARVLSEKVKLILTKWGSREPSKIFDCSDKCLFSIM